MIITGVNMNYIRIYNSIIERAKTRILPGYFEQHHILPKCLGGTNEQTNLVKLTPEEHYVVHQLLIKIYPYNHKLVFAAVRMLFHNSNNRINNKLYGWLKRKHQNIWRYNAIKMWDERKEQIIKNMKISFNKPEQIEQRSKAMKKVWSNAPEERKDQIRRLQVKATELAAKKNKELWKDPAFREKMKYRNHGNNSKKLKEKWADPIWREKMLAARKIKKENGDETE
jgi:hypothetical protein